MRENIIQSDERKNIIKRKKLNLGRKKNTGSEQSSKREVYVRTQHNLSIDHGGIDRAQGMTSIQGEKIIQYYKKSKEIACYQLLFG